MTNEVKAKAEAILMGMTQPIKDNDEAKDVLQYLIDYFNKAKNDQFGDAVEPLTLDTVWTETFRYLKGDFQIVYIGVSTLMQQFRCFNIVVQDLKEPKIEVTDRNGVLAYGYNIDAPDLSELGYMFFQKTTKGIQRIG